jgi:glycosyltransferase involved in cell wall biosynthesis
MKLIVQIPCLNEEQTLPATIRDIPRRIDGIDRIEILVVDDGSTDQTVAVARRMGVEHILQIPGNAGLGRAFAAGIDRCLMLGADVIVNTDGDNQYRGDEIPRLIQPILGGRAAIVIGDRRTAQIAHFSALKRRLQALGSYAVSRLAGVDLPDVTSGFRAYSREAAMRLVHSTRFSHTIDHVIQAGCRGITVVSVPVGTNEKLRESRLFSNMGAYVVRSLGIMLRSYSSYRAMRIFTTAGLTATAGGLLLGLGVLTPVAAEPVTPGSSFLAAILIVSGVQIMLTGIIADLVNANRTILDDASYRLRRLELADRRESDPAEGRAPAVPECDPRGIFDGTFVAVAETDCSKAA